MQSFFVLGGTLNLIDLLYRRNAECCRLNAPQYLISGC